MDVAELAGIVLTLLGLVGIGWLLRVFGVLTAEDARPIHAVIIYAGLPALIFRAVHGAELSSELGLVAAVAWMVFAFTAALAWGTARILRLPPRVAGGFILAASLGNTGYIGYPVSQALLGDEALVRAIFYDVFGTVGALLLVGIAVAQHYGSPGGRGARRVNPAREAIRFPGVIALAVALVLRPLPIPGIVSSGLDSLAMLVVPLIMLSVGLTLRMRSIGRYPVALGSLGVIRLLVAPLLAVGAGTVLLDDPATVRLVALEAGMPAMMLSIVIGARFGLDVEFLTAAVVLTTAAAIVSIPLVQVLIG